MHPLEERIDCFGIQKVVYSLEFCLYNLKHLLPIVCNVIKWQWNNIELSKL